MKEKWKLEVSGYLAEFYTSDPTTPTMWHYVVTVEGEDSILAWGQESSRERAEQAARHAIESLRGRSEAG